MTDTNVKIRAKGCASTGITDELATKLYAKKGSHLVAIVELKVDETHEKADGDRKVDLVITELEPVVDGNLNGIVEETVRKIQRALYMNRAIGTDDELPLEGTEPNLADVIAAAEAVVETDDDGNVTGTYLGEPAPV